METTEVQEPKQAEIHENVLKAQRLMRNFVNKDTEAVLVLKGNGRYAILDLQASKAGKYQLRPDELLNERWREVIPRPPKVTKPSPVLGGEGTAVPIMKEPISNPVIPPVLERVLNSLETPPEIVFPPKSPEPKPAPQLVVGGDKPGVNFQTIQVKNDPKPPRTIPGKQS